MAVDANIALQASVTKTATFSGAWLNLPTGTPRRGLVVRVLYSAASNASGANTVEWSVDTSSDGATVKGTAYVQAADNVVTLSTTAQAGEVFMRIDTSDPYIRLTCTIGGAGTVPTVTYQGDITYGRPA